MGQRRDRRLRRARNVRVGAAAVAAVTLLAGVMIAAATTLADGEIAAGSSTAAPARNDLVDRAARLDRILNAPKPERPRAGGRAKEARPAREATPTRTRAVRLAAIRAHTSTKTAITKMPPPPVSQFPPIPPNSGEGRRVVYCNSCQRVWLIEDNGWVFASYTVSGRRNYPKAGTYHVFRRINPGWSKQLRLPYFVGFTYGTTTDVGFHGIPLERDGTPIQSEAQLGTYRSHGCVRQSQWSARLMWDWATMGTKVVVIP